MWGDNSAGELGDGTTTNQSRPEPVPGLNGIVQLSASYTSFALRSDGTLFGWGLDYYGAVGNGVSSGIVTTPTPVPGLTGVTQVASSGLYTLALAGSGGTVWAWGNNKSGELGDGTTASRATPEALPLSGVTRIATGNSGGSSAAIRSDGTLLTWGDNTFGGLRNGTCCTVQAAHRQYSVSTRPGRAVPPRPVLGGQASPWRRVARPPAP